MAFFMIVRKSRPTVNISWKDGGRDKYKTKSRDYMLGSFFSTILTAITDPKDDKAIKIKSDPAYVSDVQRKSRTEST